MLLMVSAAVPRWRVMFSSVKGVGGGKGGRVGRSFGCKSRNGKRSGKWQIASLARRIFPLVENPETQTLRAFNLPG